MKGEYERTLKLSNIVDKTNLVLKVNEIHSLLLFLKKNRMK